MAGANDFLRDSVMKEIFKGAAFTPASTLWVALFTASPGSSGAGTEVTTVGTGYNRVNKTTADWTTNGIGSFINNTAVVFTTAAATTWGTLTHFAIVDSSVSSAGVAATTFYFWSTLSTNHVVNTGDAVQFSSGQLTVAMSS